MKCVSTLSCGSVLSAEELYKVDKTAMAEVLAAEERKEGDRKTQFMPEHPGEGEQELGEEEEEAEEGGRRRKERRWVGRQR